MMAEESVHQLQTMPISTDFAVKVNLKNGTYIHFNRYELKKLNNVEKCCKKAFFE